MTQTPGKRLKLCRELMGVTRERFGDLVGIGYLRMSNVENDKARMSVDDIALISLVFPELLNFLVLGTAIDVQLCEKSSNLFIHKMAKNIRQSMSQNNDDQEQGHE